MTECIRVEVRAYGALRRRLTGQAFDLASSSSLGDLLASLGLSSGQLWLISINGKRATVESQLHDGDRVELVPPIGGG